MECINNSEVQKAKGFIPWKLVAEKLAVKEVTIFKWLSKGVTDEQKERLFEAIKQVKEEMW